MLLECHTNVKSPFRSKKEPLDPIYIQKPGVFSHNVCGSDYFGVNICYFQVMHTCVNCGCHPEFCPCLSDICFVWEITSCNLELHVGMRHEYLIC